MSYTIAVLVGSLRKESLNRQLANAIAALSPAGFTFEQVPIGDLPLYDQDEEMRPPEPVKTLKAAITAASGVLFVTPEYNRSISGVLKNAIDHGSRPYGQSVWKGKPAGVMGASPGAPGASMAQQHLKNILSYLDMPTLGQPEVYLQVTKGVFNDKGELADEGTKKFLTDWMKAFVELVKAHAK